MNGLWNIIDGWWGIFQFFFLVCLTYSIFVIFSCTLENIFRTTQRIVRSINIWIRGWPPVHLDADGDHKR